MKLTLNLEFSCLYSQSWDYRCAPPPFCVDLERKLRASQALCKGSTHLGGEHHHDLTPEKDRIAITTTTSKRLPGRQGRKIVPEFPEDK